MDDNVVIVVVS